MNTGMTENFSNGMKIYRIFPANFSDIGSREYKIFTSLYQIFVILNHSCYFSM